MSLRADGYEDLRRAIISGQLSPGERLLEEDLSDAAVDELRGIVAEMHELRERGDLLGVSNANARLHGLILEASRHETAKRLSQTLSSQLVRFQYRTVLLPGRPERSHAEHTEIMEAIAAHHPKAAEDAMRRHLSHVADALRSHHDGDGREAISAGVPTAADAVHEHHGT